MFHRTRSLVGKLALIQTSFLIVALASIAFTLWVSWQLEGGAGAINEAGRMRMLSYRMTLAHGAGDWPALERDMRDFGLMVQRLRSGDPERPLFVPDTDECRERLAEVERQWPRLRGALELSTPSSELRRQADGFVASIDGLVGAIEHTIAARTAVLGGLCFGLVVLVVAASVIFVSGTYVWIIQPLQRLRDGLQRMAAGQFGARVDEGASVEEFGRLASGFNQMAQALQQAYEGLEGKVKDKTAHLARQNERLQALYDVAQMGNQPDASLESLAQSFAVKLARIARADASAVRIAAQEGERWLLLGQHCLPQAMIDAERCLRQGDCACGFTAPADGPRVIPIQAAGQPRLGHCEAAGYQTVISITMRAGARLIGEVELFHYGAHGLGEDERQLLDALVGQFAVQVDNIRLAARDREMAVSEERNLLAQELHDSIAQVLAFLKIQVQLLRGAMIRGSEQEVQASLEEIDTGVRECYANVRELLVHFRTRPGHEDIEHALRTTLAKFERQSGLSTQLSMGEAGLPLPPDQQVQVLHIVQEALSNVRKHAEADHVRLRVESSPRWLFEVQDNGRGFALSEAEAATTHVGLQIMRERADRIGASLSIETPPEGGTRVSLLLPPQARLSAEAGDPREELAA
ncbi:type IV pili methyl-accepting chemotaxis transducer N-terminal domain-containing protein [Pelomonas sp. SE-A7]|uniref:type IV pili methyl-accepting chemotaxis transducer N-terminal domain-containing protein n=1 Tax=Pelomonas sp. SE-A7 TaxID=3054953 RepID=UPI00259CC0E1|nr:type IV pili methyl-accepting chemotaxis transducer N-terminal domain-containing protein [Pelomonas sp. SE-A7]MDM4767318.1 type IV pili methyl-accepting chemotaxis transducer N-terminal domain-containing protein [Pelomonas sp. SE-A7]